MAEQAGGASAGGDVAGGQRLFARYAYAPNHLGYCGPADSAALFELGASGQTQADIPAIAARFTGAWPYLCVLAELTGIGDPLDARLVRAYWTGSALLNGIDQARFGRMLLDRITATGAGQYWSHLTTALLPEAAPTHCFHVFGVYPWTRLLRHHPERGDPPGRPGMGASGPPYPTGKDRPAEVSGENPALDVLDNCRIRWGRVLTVQDSHAIVRGRRLTWDGHALRLGEETEQAVRVRADGGSFVPDVQAGDWLAVHWNWACDRLGADELWQLRALTDWQLDMTNTRLAREAAAARR